MTHNFPLAFYFPPNKGSRFCWFWGFLGGFFSSQLVKSSLFTCECKSLYQVNWYAKQRKGGVASWEDILYHGWPHMKTCRYPFIILEGRVTCSKPTERNGQKKPFLALRLKKPQKFCLSLHQDAPVRVGCQPGASWLNHGLFEKTLWCECWRATWTNALGTVRHWESPPVLDRCISKTQSAQMKSM